MQTIPRDDDDKVSGDATDGVQCIRCGPGEYEAGRTITVTRDRPDVTLVVKDVPASVCWACGESLMTEETAERIEEMLREARAGAVETVIRRFAKAQPA